MNPYVGTAYCDVCGAEGVATGKTITQMFYGRLVQHSDPRTCAGIIKQRQRVLQEENDRLRTALQGFQPQPV